MGRRRDRVISLGVGVAVVVVFGVVTREEPTAVEVPGGLHDIDLSDCDELRVAWMGSSDFDELTILSKWMMDAGC